MRLSLHRHTGEPTGETARVEMAADDDQIVAAWLESRAATLFSPDADTLARMGSAVRAAFVTALTQGAASLDLEPGAGTFEEDSSPGRSGRSMSGHTWTWNRRRGIAAICAVAVLTLSTVGFAAAQSGPGEPFYRFRLGIETVNQPPAGTQSRLDADLVRADARLDEVAAASAAGNWSAAADAASAYTEIVAGLTLPMDATVRAQAQTRLHEQLARLEQIRARSQGSATAALDKAIAALCSLLGIPVPAVPASPASPSPVTPAGSHATPAPRATVGGPDVDRTPRPTASSRTDADGEGPGGAGGARQSPNPRPTYNFNGSRWGWPRQPHGH
jgi:hypothetical protein